MTDRINLFYYKESGNTSVLPTSVKFEYALSSNYDEDANTLTANEWFEISYAEPTDVEGFAGADRVVAKSYQLNEAINPQALRITFEHPAKSFIGLTEIEVIGTTYSYYPKTSAALTSAKFKDTVIAASLEENGTYQTNAGVPQRIEFDNPNNASLTFIYTNEDHTAAKVIAHSEDGNDTKSYNFTFTDVPTEESKQNLQEKLDSYEQATAEIEDSLKDLESFTALKDALAQISKDVHTMTESELQSSLTDLQAQYKQFYQKAIETKLNEYRSLNAAKYTAESYQQLKKVMDEIDLSKIGDLSETELMQKLNALNDAYAKLKSAALESLEAKLKEFKAIDGSKYTPETVGDNTPEMKQRREITCELLFIEIVAVGFLGIASALFKEKQMGVIRVHAIIPLRKSLFVFSKVFLFLLTDLVFAALMTLFNVGFIEAGGVLPAILIQTGILSLIMSLTGFGCTMLLKDFKQFSLAYLVIALFTATPVFLSANTAIKMDWINYHPFYHIYMGLKNAYLGTPVTTPIYYICSACGIATLFLLIQVVFRKEMGMEG